MLALYGTQQIVFDFPPSSTTRRTVNLQLTPPVGSQQVLVYLQSFDCFYTDDEQYGFGQFAVSVKPLVLVEAACAVSLRDDNINDREWQGEVVAVAMFFGPVPFSGGA